LLNIVSGTRKLTVDFDKFKKFSGKRKKKSKLRSRSVMRRNVSAYSQKRNEHMSKTFNQRMETKSRPYSKYTQQHVPQPRPVFKKGRKVPSLGPMK
jgi:hypothetical protein